MLFHNTDMEGTLSIEWRHVSGLRTHRSLNRCLNSFKHRSWMWRKIQHMQQYADIYLMQNYSTCFRRHSSHQQEYQKLYPQTPVQVILLLPLLPSNVVWSRRSPDQTTLEGSSFAVNKYLHTVAYVGFLFTLNYEARNHEFEIIPEVVVLAVLQVIQPLFKNRRP